MGIDIYLRWDEQTEEERNAQFTGFSVQHGYAGYLREAYHGGPYSTKVLLPETWDEPEQTYIPAATLRERLPDAVATAVIRERVVYGVEDVTEENCDMAKSLKDFVDLAERLEQEGKKPYIVNSY